MTIMIVSFAPKEILFASDTFRYYLREDTTERVLNHTLEITHNNLKEYVETYETNAPKIHKITRNIGLICGGDGRFSDIPEGLNKRKNIAKQILQRLKCKGKINAYWDCHIAQLGKLTSITYKNGEIETKEQITDNIWFTSFAPELKDIFFKKYINLFYLASTQEKIKIITEFFREVTELFDGLAGGIPQIAILNEKGFQQLTVQNFTTYSMNWCPEKIETVSTTEIAWSNQTWTDILSLGFECESTMLCLIFAEARAGVTKDAGTAETNAEFKLLMDDYDISGTFGWIGFVELSPSQSIRGHYSMHTVQILAKGSHTLKLVMIANMAGSTARAWDRRLSILKGFYQGGTT